MKKKLIRIILCVVAIMCISAITAFADEDYSYKDGVLTINKNDGLSSWPSTVDSGNVTSIVIGSDVTDADAFSNLNGCSNVGNITFKNATVSSGFSGLLSLTTVTFEKDCTISGAFCGCGSLGTITFKENCTISGGAFSGCANLQTIKFQGESNLTNAFQGCSNIKSITFGGATTIGQGAFSGSYPSSNSALTELVFPGGSQIQSSAFSYYTGLTSVTFKGDVILGENNTSPFENCTGLTSVKFEAGSGLFGPAFSGCNALKNISFTDKTQISSASAFSCGETTPNATLTSLVFPAGSTLCDNVFKYYTNLQTVTFEGSATIGTYIFDKCSQLKNFYFNSTDTSGISLANLTFVNFASTGDKAINIYVPETALEAYKNKLTSLGTPSTNYASCVKANDAHATHSWSEGVCSICNVACKHAGETTGDWITDSNQHWKVYSTCGAKSDLGNHSWSNGVCSTCNLACTHNWSEGACSICTLACSHSWSNGVCNICRLVCTHADEAKQWAYNETQHWKVYSTCGAKTDPANHEYGTDNKCTTCGYTKPVATYSGGGGISTQKPTVTTPENGKVTLSNNGRTATITPEEGYQVASVTVNGVDKGKVTELTGLKTGDEVVVTFEKTKETLDKEASEAVGALSSMKARSSKTSKSNVKIVMNLSSTEKAKLVELKAQGYTVKYKFYRSTKKSSGYTAMKTKDTTTYINTKGVKKTMYYYKARVLVYDQDGKLVASTKLSDCKYANRTWTKK